MKYNVGNIVLLHDGRSVYIYQVDEKARKYFVIDTVDDKSNFISVIRSREISAHIVVQTQSQLN